MEGPSLPEEKGRIEVERERERCREVTEEVGLKVQDKRAERAERSELTG